MIPFNLFHLSVSQFMPKEAVQTSTMVLRRKPRALPGHSHSPRFASAATLEKRGSSTVSLSTKFERRQATPGQISWREISRLAGSPKPKLRLCSLPGRGHFSQTAPSSTVAAAGPFWKLRTAPRSARLRGLNGLLQPRKSAVGTWHLGPSLPCLLPVQNSRTANGPSDLPGSHIVPFIAAEASLRSKYSETRRSLQGYQRQRRREPGLLVEGNVRLLVLGRYRGCMQGAAGGFIPA